MLESAGRKLQQARIARKLGIEDVAEKTKIRPDRIIDLEADEYSNFPNLTYAKSFLAKYARFLGVDIQEDLDKFQVSQGISMGDYQYLRSLPVQDHAHEPRRLRRIAPKGFRVPPLVVGILVFIVLVGVPLFSYLSLNIPRVAGTDGVSMTGNRGQPGVITAKTAIPTPSDTDSLESLAGRSQFGESAAVASPTPSQEENVKADASPAPANLQTRIEEGIEVRRALPAGAPQSANQADTPGRTSLSTLPEMKLEVRALKRTYVKVTKDEEDTQPVFEGFAAPDSRPIVVEGKRFWVHVRDKGAVEVRKDGQLVLGNSDDIVID
jgi:cytoskeletal protein RodZ